MKLNQLLITLSLTCSFLGGCFQQQVSRADLSPMTERLLSERGSREWGIMNSYKAAPVGGELFIIGGQKDCAALSSRLLLSDDFDNVDGSARPDRLPDFAGERIASVVDTLLSEVPLQKDSAAVMAYRDRVVRLFLATLDTLYCADRFGYELNAVKPRSKVVMIPSGDVYELAGSDIDTLLKASGAEVRVLFTSEILSSNLEGRHGKGAVSIALDSIPSTGTPLRSLLQAYSASGEVRPVSAVVIRNFGISSVELMKECDQILRGETWDDFELSKLIGSGFEVLDPVELTVRECFRTLRRSNLFTHDIAYPISHTYMVETNGQEPILKKNVQN